MIECKWIGMRGICAISLWFAQRGKFSVGWVGWYIEPSVWGQYALIHLKKWSMKLWSVNLASWTKAVWQSSCHSHCRMSGHFSIASTQIYAQITDQKTARNMDWLTEKCKTGRK